MEGSVTLATPRLVDEFYRSAFELCRLISRVATSKTTSRLLTVANTASPMINLADIFTLGLDVCGRAMVHLHNRAHMGTTTEYDAVSRYAEQLKMLAAEFHMVAKEDLIRSNRRSRMVKRALKSAKLRFADFDSFPTTERIPGPGSYMDHSRSSSYAASSLDGSQTLFPVIPITSSEPITAAALQVPDMAGIGVLDSYSGTSSGASSPFDSPPALDPNFNRRVRLPVRSHSETSAGMDPEQLHLVSPPLDNLQALGMDAWAGDASLAGLHQQRFAGPPAASNVLWNRPDLHHRESQSSLGSSLDNVHLPQHHASLSLDGSMGNFMFNHPMSGFGPDPSLTSGSKRVRRTTEDSYSSVPSLGNSSSPSDGLGRGFSIGSGDMDNDTLLSMSMPPDDPLAPEAVFGALDGSSMFPPMPSVSMNDPKQIEIHGIRFNSLNEINEDELQDADVDMTYGYPS